MDKSKQMSPSEYIKYLADNHIKISVPEDKRKYPGQQCQDDKLNEDFRKLHKELVNKVISFCKEHNITIDDFSLSADGIADSIPYGSWQPCTDSSLRFEKYSQEYKDVISMNKIVSEYEFNKILINEEPFMLSL